MISVGIECESIEESETWGLGRIISKLLEEISKHPELGNEFKFFLYFKSKIPDYPYLASPLFIKKIIRVPPLPPSFSLYYYVFLPIKLYFERLDTMFFPNYMLPIIFVGKSLVNLTEDVYYEFKHGNLPFRYKLAYKIFAGWAAKRATKILAMSESSKMNLAKLFNIEPDRIVTNQLGIDTPKVATNRQVVGNYLLYVGQAFPRRHLRETILAFEKISSRFPDLKLITIGKDKYNPPIISELVREVNRQLGKHLIIHKDYVSQDELVSLYSHAKCLIYVSSKEAFGLPPLEALAYGTVPIVSRSAVTKEIFGNDKAFFVEDQDSVDSIAKTLNEALINTTKRQNIINSADTVLKKYTWSAYTDRFLKIIRELKTL